MCRPGHGTSIWIIIMINILSFRLLLLLINFHAQNNLFSHHSLLSYYGSVLVTIYSYHRLRSAQIIIIIIITHYLFCFCLSGAFAKLRKATLSFVVSVRPFGRMEQLGFHWTDFHEIWYLSILKKSVTKIQVSLRSDKNNGYFPMKSNKHFFIIYRSVLLRMKRCLKKKKLQRKSKHAFYVQWPLSFFF